MLIDTHNRFRAVGAEENGVEQCAVQSRCAGPRQDKRCSTRPAMNVHLSEIVSGNYGVSRALAVHDPERAAVRYRHADDVLELAWALTTPTCTAQ
ncbi:MAG: hypothetical protein WDZ58_06165 [Gemmatimonadaceae bacterium]